MFTVKLYGGLGNQMFQYAFGRAMSNYYSQELCLDLSWFRRANRPHFNPSILSYAIKQTKCESHHTWQSRLMNKLRKYGVGGRQKNLLSELMFAYDKNVWELQSPTELVIDGYWQSYKYFSNIEHEIRSEFTIQNERIELLRMIQSLPENSVSIHVRRGDYVTDERANAVHGTCDLAYYKASMEMVASAIGLPHYVVFSDDIEWARTNFKLPDATYIEPSLGFDDYEELILMSSCAHNIIANSTFSWWAGWLNANPKKLVVAPKRWFRERSFVLTDLFPDTWKIV